MIDLDNESLDGRMDWFYPHQINSNLGLPLGEMNLIVAKQGTGKSFWDSMTPHERKVWLNKEFGK